VVAVKLPLNVLYITLPYLNACYAPLIRSDVSAVLQLPAIQKHCVKSDQVQQDFTVIAMTEIK
jgi:hypothetical protein